MIATKTAVEIVRFQPENSRGVEMFTALKKAAPAAGIDVIETSAYRGESRWMMAWGPGAPARRDAIRTHVAKGGRAIALDLAYWQRESKVRISFDGPHPQAFVMRKNLPTDRYANDILNGVRAEFYGHDGKSWNPNGPIVIAGLGPKALVQYGEQAISEWEADMMRACRARWSRPIIYRPKKAENAAPGWASSVSRGGAIEDVLRGASLVITWHSNVAVDAIRMGIPVVCRDGAAAAVCPSELPDQPVPLPVEVRDRFLANLAWFQWAPSEASACWRFLQEQLS